MATATRDVTNWVVSYQSEDLSLKIENKDGIAWHDAPLPHRWHRCRTQTRGWQNFFTEIDRCACGATRRNGGHWVNRNETRKSR